MSANELTSVVREMPVPPVRRSGIPDDRVILQGSTARSARAQLTRNVMLCPPSELTSFATGLYELSVIHGHAQCVCS